MNELQLLFGFHVFNLGRVGIYRSMVLPRNAQEFSD